MTTGETNKAETGERESGGGVLGREGGLVTAR